MQQKIQLVKTENLNITVEDDALRLIAKCAHELNSTVSDFGGRRVKTVIEAVLEDCEFNAPELSGSKLVIDKEYVSRKVEGMVKRVDYGNYVL